MLRTITLTDARPLQSSLQSLSVNPSITITFKCAHATPLDLIRATGRQTRIPFGLVLGLNPSILEKQQRFYDLEGVTAQNALTEATRDTGYSLREEDEVLLLIAGDLTPRQASLLYLQYANFQASGSMVEMAANLTGWMWAATHPISGYGASILGSTNDERFMLEWLRSATTEEIANKIVSQGSGNVSLGLSHGLSASSCSLPMRQLGGECVPVFVS